MYKIVQYSSADHAPGDLLSIRLQIEWYTVINPTNHNERFNNQTANVISMWYQSKSFAGFSCKWLAIVISTLNAIGYCFRRLQKTNIYFKRLHSILIHLESVNCVDVIVAWINHFLELKNRFFCVFWGIPSKNDLFWNSR